ncbi:MAG: hypothetical protein WC551_09535 [Patescibacteria group bacterium]
MPINVEHGGQAGPVAGQIIAQSGQANLNRQQQEAELSQRLRQQRALQLADIDARADLQRQAADEAMARTALQHGLDGQIKEEEFDRTIKQMQEQARVQAQQWEYQYTAQQRQEIARFNAARQTITGSDSFSPEEKEQALRMVDMEQANIKPAMMPRDPSKPIYPDGRGVGESWIADDGSTLAREADGNVKLIQRYDQGPKAQQAKLQMENQKIQLQAQQKREEKLLDLRLKLATEDVEQLGADGKTTYRMRSSKEVDEIMRTVLGGGQQQQQQQEVAWWDRPENAALKATDSDKDLPPQVGYAQAYLRQMNARYGGIENVPPDFQQAYIGAASVLKQYTTGGQ